MSKPTILIVSNSYKASPYNDYFGLKRKVMRAHPLAPYIFAAQTPSHFDVKICDIEDVKDYYSQENIAMAAFSTNVTCVVPKMYKASDKFHEKNIPDFSYFSG